MAFRKHDIASIVERLRHIALFAQVENADLEKLAQLGEPVDAEPGAVIMEQGDVGLECFLVLEGEAGVLNGDEHIATIGPGSIVGEMALIAHKPRNASVVAQTPMHLLAFDIRRFKLVLDERPAARDYIYALLQERAAANQDR